MTRLAARRHLGMIGHAVSAGERHAQSSGEKAGTFLRALKVGDLDVESILVKLGEIGRCLPRDSTTTLFLSELELSFTGEPDEEWNRRVVRETNLRLNAACDFLRPVRAGYLRCDAVEASDAIRGAACEVGKLLPLYRGYMQAGEDGRVRMQRGFFLRWREYLVAYEVGGETILGPNPAHIVGWPRLDAATGGHDEAFLGTVLRRVALMTPEDGPAIEADFRLPSLAEIFIDGCGLDVAGERAPDREAFLRAIAAKLEGGLKNSIRAYAELIANAKALTAVHWSLIVNFIVKPSKDADQGAAIRLSSPEEGRTGKPLEHTHGLMRMRRDHPATELFVALSRTIDKG